jgi:hypothetical protein
MVGTARRAASGTRETRAQLAVAVIHRWKVRPSGVTATLRANVPSMLLLVPMVI